MATERNADIEVTERLEAEIDLAVRADVRDPQIWKSQLAALEDELPPVLRQAVTSPACGTLRLVYKGPLVAGDLLDMESALGVLDEQITDYQPYSVVCRRANGEPWVFRSSVGRDYSRVTPARREAALADVRERLLDVHPAAMVDRMMLAIEAIARGDTR